MKRYRAYYTNDFGNEYDAFSEEAEDGDWVRFDDVKALLERQLRLLDDSEMGTMGDYFDECDAVRCDVERALGVARSEGES